MPIPPARGRASFSITDQTQAAVTTCKKQRGKMCKKVLFVFSFELFVQRALHYIIYNDLK